MIKDAPRVEVTQAGSAAKRLLQLVKRGIAHSLKASYVEDRSGGAVFHAFVRSFGWTHRITFSRISLLNTARIFETRVGLTSLRRLDT